MYFFVIHCFNLIIKLNRRFKLRWNTVESTHKIVYLKAKMLTFLFKIVTYSKKWFFNLKNTLKPAIFDVDYHKVAGAIEVNQKLSMCPYRVAPHFEYHKKAQMAFLKILLQCPNPKWLPITNMYLNANNGWQNYVFIPDLKSCKFCLSKTRPLPNKVLFDRFYKQNKIWR